MSREQLIKTEAMFDRGLTVAEQMREVADLMERLQQAPVMQKEDVMRFMDLSVHLTLRVQNQALEIQQQTIDYCTEYREQIAILTESNDQLATILYKQSGAPIGKEGHA